MSDINIFICHFRNKQSINQSINQSNKQTKKQTTKVKQTNKQTKKMVKCCYWTMDKSLYTTFAEVETTWHNNGKFVSFLEFHWSV